MPDPVPESAPQPLTVACLAMTATADVAANAAAIRSGMHAAAKAGARVLLTPECSLPGYPSAARADFTDISWCQVADEEERLEREARVLGIMLVLGTASPMTAYAAGVTTAVSNDALVIGASSIPIRYRKRSLTPIDAHHFSAGDVPCVVVFAGWKLGITICYEARFAPLWAEQARAGVDAFLHIAHMAGPDVDPGTKAQVIPALYSTRAAEWATPLVVANTAASDRWVDTGAWDVRGVRTGGMSEGLFVTTIIPRTQVHPWYEGLRQKHLALIR